jgi:nicotinamide-nucleotide amidase
VEAELEQLAAKVGDALKLRHWMLATAESCTGGWIAQAITAVAGSSVWFDRGFVTYSNAAKQELLGVPQQVIEQHGAVSLVTVRAMAEGALEHSHARITVAVSGIAGPGGAVPGKPVGTVFIATARKDGETVAQELHLAGDRTGVRRQAVAAALNGVLDRLGEDA